MDVDHAVSLDPALEEVSPYDDDRLDPLATAGTSLKRVAQARGSCAKPAPAERGAAGGKSVSGDDSAPI